MTAKNRTLHLEPAGEGKYSIRLERASIGAVRELLEERLKGIDEATKLVRADLVRVPSEVDIKLGGAKDLFNAELRLISEKFIRVDAEFHTRDKAVHAAYISHKDFGDARAKFVDEKFSSIETQFKERDIRVEENKTASDKGIADAFAAAEKVGQEQTRNFKEVIEKSEAANTKVMDQIQNLLKEVQKSLDEKINALDLRLTRAEGSRSGMWAIGAVVISILIAVGSVWLRK